MSQDKGGRFRWIARYLDRETVSQIAPANWIFWRTTADYYRGIGYRFGTLPPQTGDMFVQSPYADWYNLVWGLAPNQDMPKWRWMYRARPEVRAGIDKKTILAVGRGFQIVVPDDQEVEAYCVRLMDILNIRDTTQAAVSDMLVYGQAYFEKVRGVGADEQEHERLELSPIEKRVEGADAVTHRWDTSDLDFTDDVADFKAAEDKLKLWVADMNNVEQWVDEKRDQITVAFKAQRERYNAWLNKIDRQHYEATVKAKKRWKAQEGQRSGQGIVNPGNDLDLRKTRFEPEEGELVELKGLDPLWMRITRDAFGNVTGFLQWGLTPIPQAVISEKIVYLRWLPKTWAHENAYGVSVLMPIQRHISMLIQAEEDMKIFWHQYAKPMLAIYGGTQEKPYPQPMLASLQTKLSARQPNTDAVMPGDTKIEVIKGGTGDTQNTFKTWSKYLREKIYEALGIPSILMNLPDLTTRATSDVSLQAFIAEERMIQEMVGEQLLKQVIEPEVRRHFQDKYPRGEIPSIKIVWPSVLEEDRNKKADRIVKLTGRPAISVNEARTELGFPPLDDPQYDEIAEMAQPGFGQASKPEESATQSTGPREELKQKQELGTEASEDVIAG